MNHNYLSTEEQARYSRHMIMPDFGVEAQLKLKKAHVLVVGAGGLGSPLLLYLAAAGVGHIGIMDFDVVDESNLHRQVLYGVEDVGVSKVEAASRRLHAVNPYIKVAIYNTQLTSKNALEIISNFDVVADGTDNFPTRYLVNDACVLLNKPNVYASIYQFEGQVSVFNYVNAMGERGPNYRDLYPIPPQPGMVANCAEAGVLGVLPGIIGSMQALEVIKVITGVGTPLSGRLFTYDALTFESRTFNVKRKSGNPLNGESPTMHSLVDYEQLCGVSVVEREVKSVSPKQVTEWMQQGMPIQMIDVRDPHEYELVNIGTELIPLASIIDRADRIEPEKRVVVFCKSGMRSAKAIRLLEDKYQLNNLYNLEGGIVNYINELQLDLPSY